MSMAGVTTTFLRIHEPDEEPDPSPTFDVHPYSAHHDFEDIYSSDLDFQPPDRSLRRPGIVTVEQDEDEYDCDDLFTQYQSTVHVMRSGGGNGDGVSESNSIPSPDLPDRENQVNFVMDLFQQRVEQSQVTTRAVLGSQVANDDSNFGVIEVNCDVDVDGLDLDLNLGLGSGLDFSHDFSHSGNDDDDLCDYDDFCFGRRVSGSESGDEAASNLGGTEALEECMGLVDFGTDSEEEDENGVIGIDLNSAVDEYDEYHRSLPMSWLVEDQQRESTEDFEWEEVDGRVDMRDVSLAISAVVARQEEEQNAVERTENLDSLQWEVLMNASNWETNADADDYIYTADYDMMFGQFSENEIASTGRPPAAASVVENLPSVVVAEEDVEEGNALCAVCKDDMNVGEETKQLPCAHRYHGDCIVPWLRIRNTCPVCRHELPTDDHSYERRRTQGPSPGFDYYGGEVLL